MLLHQIMRIPEFSGVSPTELRALAARSHVLCLPERRWLIREGKPLDAYFYLLKGTIETGSPRRKWRASAFGRLKHFSPGCVEVRALGAVQILRIDAAHREFVLQDCALPPLAASGAEPWLKRFLGSHMMRQLTATQWQDVLSAFQAYEFAAGSRILCRGQPGDHCFVLEAGHAIVHRGQLTLSHLCPGDLFGEDAVVLNRVRNADVTALEPVRVHAINGAVFSRVLVENLVQFVCHAERGITLCLDASSVRPDVHVELSRLREFANQLDPRSTYYVKGGQRRERALAALLLLQRGFKAHALDV